MNNKEDFNPNWASMPGDTISRILADKNLSVDEFSKMIGSSAQELDLLLNGFISINESIASKLHSYLGGSIQFWLNREQQYGSAKKRLQETESKIWLSELPVKDMKRHNWIDEDKNIFAECLKFFDVPDVWAWRKKFRVVDSLILFRKSQKINSNPYAIATWIRQGEIEAEKISCSKWNPTLFMDSLQKMKSLSRQKDNHAFVLKLIEACANCGVALVVVPTPQECTASGAAKFLNSEKAMIILSFRFRTDDHLWFTFFHEAGHLLMHDKNNVYVDENIEEATNEYQENQANDFASKILVPTSLVEKMQRMSTDIPSIKSIANSAQVSLGIIVGQLQHMKRISNARFNRLKRKYDLDEILKTIREELHNH